MSIHTGAEGPSVDPPVDVEVPPAVVANHDIQRRIGALVASRSPIKSAKARPPPPPLIALLLTVVNVQSYATPKLARCYRWKATGDGGATYKRRVKASVID